MKRSEYASCVGKGLKGKKFSKEERKLEFCVLSKLCSGKSKDREDAKRICSQPKEPKPKKLRATKSGGISCEKEVLGLSGCMVEHIDMNLASNINSVGTAIANAMMRCKCPQQ